jgi:putative tryptophan/tyrosine transport system substrate-binding protein
MERRAFVGGFGASLLGLPSTPTYAQPAKHLRTVAVLMGVANDKETEARTEAVETGLAKRGWIVGKNLRIEYRFAASDAERIFSLAKELVALHPDVIIAHSTPVLTALHRVTQTIPIVFVVVADPVGSGFIESIAHPGGNITGFTVVPPTITGKYLSILKELEPQLSHVTLMYDPESIPQGGTPYLPAFLQSAKEFDIVPATAVVRNPNDIENLMTGLGSAGTGLIVFAGNFTTLHRVLIISLAARLRIPTIYPYRYFAEEGGLLSYGIDVLDLFRRAPDYVDRILKGAKPADLPVQAPRKFELVINLRAARSAGLAVPRILLASADALIE